MLNLNQCFRLCCLFVLLNLCNKALGQGSEAHKFGYCLNPLNLWYEFNTSGGPPVPPYTITWTINGVTVRTAPAVFSYSPIFGHVSWHDSLYSLTPYPSLQGPYVFTATMTNTSGYSANYTWNVQYDSLTIIKTDAPASCTGPTQGSIVIVPYGPTNIADYTIVLNPGNITGTTFNNLPVGNYTITIDGNNQGGGWFINGVSQGNQWKCHSVIPITITQPALLSATATNSKVGTCGLPNGEVSVSTSGGTGTKTYFWNPGGATAQTASALPAGTYTVTVTDAMGCTSTSSATIVNSGAITATMGPVTDINCFGGNNGTTSATVGNGIANYTYAWSNSVTTTNASPINSITNLTATGYTVTVTDGRGCTATTSVILTQPPALNVPTPATSPALCGTATGTISVSPAGGSPAYSYSWSNGLLAQTGTGLAAGSYTVTVTDSKGCTQSASGTIAGSGAATISILSKNDVTCFGANNGSATVAGGGTSDTFIWSSGQTTASVTGLMPGTYSVTVNSGGCLADTFLTIQAPTDLVIVASSTTTPCGNNGGQVSVSPTGGTGSYTYLWSPGGAAAQTVSGLAAGTYVVTVSDNNACTKSAQAIVSSLPGPTVSVSAPTNVTCNGATTGSVTATGASGTSPYNYTWSCNPVQYTSTATNLGAGIYTVTVSDVYGCTTTTSSTITEPSKVTATPPTGQTVCIGQNATLSTSVSGGTPAYNYIWNPGGLTGSSVTVNPAMNATYTVIVTDASGCTTSQTVSVSVNPPLLLTATGTKSVCNGASTPLSAAASGGNGGPYIYSWMPGGLTGTTVTVIPPAGVTDYTVTVTDGCGSPAATSVVKVTVNPPPVIQYTANVTNGCTPFKVTFTNSTANSASCFWEFGDGQNSSICNDTAHTYFAAGTYTVKLTVTDINGCVNTLTSNDMIQVFAPVADFNMSATSVSIYEPSIAFTDMSINPSKWLWDFGDNGSTSNSSSLTNPTHVYSDTGVYCVKLIIHDSAGCTSNTVKCLTILPEYTFYVPNAFSPNEDGVNETFNGKGLGISKYKMLVFDRWGNLIFTTNDINYGWDGGVKSSTIPVQQDVYVYKIVVTDIFTRVHNYIGHISVVR